MRQSNGWQGRDTLLAAHGKQRGDPMRGAKAITTAIEANQPPLHFVIGGDTFDLIRKKVANMQQDLDT
ncbi:hypothetical protein [Labrys miyagiensis]|nr:hypothetical protein [Labrys miyagiensis]